MTRSKTPVRGRGGRFVAKSEGEGTLSATTSTNSHVTGNGCLDFEEDRTILDILSNKVFRRAISQGSELLLLPDVEKEARVAVPELTEAMKLLDAAREGTEIDTALAEWKEELVGQAP